MFNNKDLTKVFDDRWKANHNDDVKINKDNNKRFNDRLFDVKDEDGEIKGNLQRNFDRLNKNLETSKKLQIENRIRNLRGKNNG